MASTGLPSLTLMPAEIILSIAESLPTEKDIRRLACTNRYFNRILTPYLFKYNVKHYRGDALWWAIRHGERSVAEKVLDAGADIRANPDRHDGRGTPGSDPLFHLAITTRPRNICYLRNELYKQYVDRHLSLLELLLERGMDIEQPGGDLYGDGCTALQLAASLGQNEVVQFLINHGANVKARCRKGSTVLYYAVHGVCSEEIVKFLIDKGLDVNDTGERNLSPLHVAALTANEKICRVLIEHGAHVNQVAYDGCTPLMRAAEIAGGAATMELLIEHGAEINGPCYSESKKSNDDDETAVRGPRYYPLSKAARARHAEGVRLLLECGASVNMTDMDGKTPLHDVLAHREFAYEPLRHRGFVHELPAHKDFKEKIELSRLLIEKGAHVNAKNRFESTPLHTAAAMGDVEATKLLIEHGAEVNAKDSIGYSPLHFALSATEVRTELATVLLEAGADVTSKTNKGNLPLMETPWRPAQVNDWIKKALAKYKDKNVMPEVDICAAHLCH